MTRLLAVLVVLVGLSGLVGCKTHAPVVASPTVEEAVAKPEVAEKPTAPVPVKAVVVPTPPAPKPVVETPKPEPPAPKAAVVVPKPEPPAPKPVVAVPKPAPPAPKPAEVAPKPEPPKPAPVPVETKPEPKPATKVEDKPAVPPKTEEAVKPAPPKPKAPAPKPAPAKPLGDVDAKTWEIPGSADMASWAAATWDNRAVLSQAEGGIKVECQGGEKDKSSAGLKLNPAADLTSRTALVLDITNGNPEAAKVALAVLTNGRLYFESQPKSVSPGANKAVDFDLKAKGYKAEKTKWEYSTAIDGLDATNALYFVIYGKEKGIVTLSNLALVSD